MSGVIDLRSRTSVQGFSLFRTPNIKIGQASFFGPERASLAAFDPSVLDEKGVLLISYSSDCQEAFM